MKTASIDVWKVDEDGHPYPWRFAVTFEGRRHEFAGVPNQCATRRSAAMRAAWRLRWMIDGTFAQRYR